MDRNFVVGYVRAVLDELATVHCISTLEGKKAELIRLVADTYTVCIYDELNTLEYARKMLDASTHAPTVERLADLLWLIEKELGEVLTDLEA